LKIAFLTQIMIVGAGGFIGSALRFVVSTWTQRLAATGDFPYGTLVVNVAGCLLIGLLGGLAEYRQVLEPATRLFLLVGILGGFTTFSTFAYETLSLAQDADFARALINTLLQVVLGFAAAFVGVAAARSL
jgi:CrcB protein